MYYSSNNNDYYNSYKKEISELEGYKKEEKKEKLIKFILSLFALALFIIASLYLYKYFNPNLNLKNSLLKNEKEFSKNKVFKNIVIREETLPVSVQLDEPNIKTTKISTTTRQKKQEVVASISEKDIALIVQIIMSQMNGKTEVPLEEQLQKINNNKFVDKRLEEVNHYNKIVLTKNEILEVKNASLVKLTTSLSNIINEGISSNSNYTQEITKEVIFRKNEMRVIIVQNGDTLSKIAKKAYGNHGAYKKIFVANPEIIKNPNQIFVGQRLRIPS
jgi:LysM repeat protein